MFHTQSLTAVDDYFTNNSYGTEGLVSQTARYKTQQDVGIIPWVTSPPSSEMDDMDSEADLIVDLDTGSLLAVPLSTQTAIDAVIESLKRL